MNYNTKPDHKKSIMWFHILVGLLMVYLGAEYHDAYGSCMNGYYLLLHLYLVYCLTLLSFFVFKDWARTICLICVSIICLSESLIGLKQILGFQTSNNYLFAVTGSFQNPGPYGGFMVVCISILWAYCVKERLDYKRTVRTKLLFYMSLIAAISGTIIFPLSHSRSSVLALGFSALLFVIGNEYIKQRIKRIHVKNGILLIVGLIVLIVGAYNLKKPSADGRFYIDRISLKAMSSGGMRGVGTGHFGGAYGDTQALEFKELIDERGKDNLDWTVIPEHERLIADCPDNSFNEYLNLGVEEGPIVMSFLIILLIVAITISYKRGTIWCYGLTALAVFACFSYPFHIRQFQIMLVILMGACISDGLFPVKDRTWIASIIPNAAIVVALLAMAPNLKDLKKYKEIDKAWRQVQFWNNNDYFDYVVEDCEDLFPYLRNDYNYLFIYGKSLNKIGDYEKSDHILKMGADISSDPMFWNIMGNNSLALGRYREAEERYIHAFLMVPNRLYPLCLLTKLYYAEGDFERARKMEKMVMEFKPKVESSTTRELRNEIADLISGMPEGF